MNVVELTNALAKALGVPNGCTKAVLTLEVGKVPTLQLDLLAIGLHAGLGKIVGEKSPDELRKIEFMLRLEPFPRDLK